MFLFGGHMCMCIPSMKFLCLTLCQGEVYTDDADADANNADTNNDRQFMINQMSQKALKNTFPGKKNTPLKKAQKTLLFFKNTRWEDWKVSKNICDVF